MKPLYIGDHRQQQKNKTKKKQEKNKKKQTKQNKTKQNGSYKTLPAIKRISIFLLMLVSKNQ